MLAICWQYLGGRSVATDPTDRTRAEWPPHPDRVFQALVAAWGGRGQSGHAALSWLCSQGVPCLLVPRDHLISAGAVVRTYVPVNDIEGPRRGAYGDKHLGLIPSYRKRSSRVFPATNVGVEVCALVWPQVVPDPDVREALGKLCRAVTYIGHSSSLVRVWLADEAPEITHVPVSRRAQLMLRVPDPSRLDSLILAYADGGQASSRPPQSGWQGYALRSAASTPSGAFDDRPIVLRQVGGQRLDLLQTLALARGLRGTLIKAADDLPGAKRILSGHEADGSPLGETHAAYLPLAYLGDPRSSQRHADGHLLGVAIALPNTLAGDVEQDIFDALASARRANSGPLKINLGRTVVVELEPDAVLTQAWTLRPETWTRPARVWGSVTPIVLDRLPPRRHADHDGWAVDQIAQACLRQGLPAPELIELMSTSAHVGSPAARVFPALLRKDGTRRWHLHARIQFSLKVRGPLVLGAGRYQGYGLCKPLTEQVDA
jgi:CRISPR-associated protein Csb2